MFLPWRILVTRESRLRRGDRPGSKAFPRALPVNQPMIAEICPCGPGYICTSKLVNMAFDSWTLEFHSGIPAYKQIIHHIQAAIAAGALAEGDQLPTIRALHQILDVNPNTVARAYRELQTLGVIISQQGSGCFVAPMPKNIPLKARARQAKVREIAARLAAEARSHQIPVTLIVETLQHDLGLS